MKITFDKHTFYTIASLISNCYGYPMSDVKEKSGYSREEFEAYDKKMVSKEELTVDSSDLPIVIAGVKLAVNEMTTGFPAGHEDGDLLTIVDITKAQGFKLLSLLESVAKDPKKEVVITWQDWQKIEK
jgi:hypothetical protein